MISKFQPFLMFHYIGCNSRAYHNFLAIRQKHINLKTLVLTIPFSTEKCCAYFHLNEQNSLHVNICAILNYIRFSGSVFKFIPLYQQQMDDIPITSYNVIMVFWVLVVPCQVKYSAQDSLRKIENQFQF